MSAHSSQHQNSAGDDAELERLRGAEGRRCGGDGPPCDAMWASIDAAAREETSSMRGRLRALRTSTRVLIAVGFAFVVAATFLLITGYRTDLTTQTVIRYGALMVGLLGLDALVFSVALRPAHRPPLRWQTTLAIAGGLLVPVILALLPDLWVDETTQPESEVFLCIVPGVMTATVVSVLVWFLQRGTAPTWGRVLSVVVGGGVTGFAMLQMHCPARDAEHMLIGHASVGVAMVILTSLLLGLRRLWQR